MSMYVYLFIVFLNLISNINHDNLLSATFKVLVRPSLMMGQNNSESYMHTYLSNGYLNAFTNFSFEKLGKGATL